MRQLTVKQKQLLTTVIQEHPDIQSVDDVSLAVWEELEAMNDTEILWQEVNRYIADKRMEAIR